MKIIMVYLLTCCSFNLFAQNNSVEAEIRLLEQKEVDAILQKDSAALLELWATDYVVNAPDNVINFAGKTTLDRPVLKRPRVAFTRQVEHVSVKGTFAFTMGSETVTPGTDSLQSAKAITRRFTNIWEKQSAGWRLVARHANVICSR